MDWKVSNKRKKDTKIHQCYTQRICVVSHFLTQRPFVSAALKTLRSMIFNSIPANQLSFASAAGSFVACVFLGVNCIGTCDESCRWDRRTVLFSKTWNIDHRKLTWNLKMMVSKRNLLFQEAHVQVPCELSGVIFQLNCCFQSTIFEMCGTYLKFVGCALEPRSSGINGPRLSFRLTAAGFNVIQRLRHYCKDIIAKCLSILYTVSWPPNERTSFRNDLKYVLKIRSNLGTTVPHIQEWSCLVLTMEWGNKYPLYSWPLIHTMVPCVVLHL